MNWLKAIHLPGTSSYQNHFTWVIVPWFCPDYGVLALLCCFSCADYVKRRCFLWCHSARLVSPSDIIMNLSPRCFGGTSSKPALDCLYLLYTLVQWFSNFFCHSPLWTRGPFQAPPVPHRSFSAPHLSLIAPFLRPSSWAGPTLWETLI